MKIAKKILLVAIALCVSVILPSVVVYAIGDISVTIDGEQVDFEGQGPANIDGRILVPVRGVFEYFGFEPSWDGENNQATLTNNSHVVVLTIGSATFTTNGESFVLDVPAQNIGGRVLVPLRAVLESIFPEIYLGWNGQTSTVIISTLLDIDETFEPSQEAEDKEDTTTGFNFALPEGIALNPAVHVPSNFIWVRVQGVLPEFNSLLYADEMLLEMLTHGIIGGVFHAEAVSGDIISAADVVEDTFSRLVDGGTYLLRMNGTVDISAAGTSAVLSLQTWSRASDNLLSLFYLAQEMPNGELIGFMMIFSLNSLDDDAIAFLEELSAQVGYDFLTNAVADMERALSLISFIHSR